MEPPTLATLNESLEEFANNLTSKNITTETRLNPFYFYETEQFTVLWILFFAIVIGNAAVLFALLAHKGRKSRMNFFIMHLALADLSVGLISVLTDIIWRITISWYAGNIACKIIRFLQAIVTYSSTYVLVALSIDRYDAITHPMNFSGGWRRARILIATAWLLSILFCIPIIILYQERLIEGQWQCWIELAEQWQWQIYISLVALTLFLIPAFIITACYSVIVYTIWSKSKMLTARPKDSKRKEANSVTGEEPDCRRASSRGLIPKAKIKTVKMTFVIVFVFILCWSPYIFFDTLQVFGYVPKTQANIALASFIQSLAWLNSAANPIIYCLFSTHLCRNLRRCPLFGLVTGERPGISESGLGGGGRYLNSHTDTTSVTEPLTSHVMTSNSISVVAARRSRHLSTVM